MSGFILCFESIGNDASMQKILTYGAICFSVSSCLFSDGPVDTMIAVFVFFAFFIRLIRLGN